MGAEGPQRCLPSSMSCDGREDTALSVLLHTPLYDHHALQLLIKVDGTSPYKRSN